MTEKPVKQKKKSIELPISEITLRKYEKPSSNLIRREIFMKICLSLGLLQPGDSRDIIVDILQAIAESKKPLTTRQIMKKVEAQRKKQRIELLGLTYPNVCRQLRRLKQLMLIESRADKYRLNENDSIKNTFNEKIMKFYVESIKDRINEYLALADKSKDKSQ